MIGVSRTGRLLGGLVGASCARPRAVIGLAVGLAALAVWYTATHLGFVTSTHALLPRHHDYVQRFEELDEEFGELDDLVVAVQVTTLPEAKAYAARLVERVRRDRVPLEQVAYRVDPGALESRGLLYLPLPRLAELRDRLFDSQEFLEGFAARPTLDQFVEGLAGQVASAFVGGFLDLGLGPAAGAAELRAVEEIVAQLSQRLERRVPYRSPWGSVLDVGVGDPETLGYFLSDDSRLLFVLAQPTSSIGSFTGDRDAIEGVRRAIAGLRTEFPRIEAGVTGKHALAVDEMTAAFRDSEHATVLAFVLTLGLLLAAFRRVIKPLVMLAVLTLALCWSLGAATLVVGHLSLFSVMFISIVIGIGIDYGIYFLFRYEEEVFLGRPLREALEITGARAGPGMLLGALTAAAAFYVLMLTDFPGLQELGFIAGTAIVLSWAAMATVFPAILVLLDRRRPPPAEGEEPRALALEHVHVPLLERVVARPAVVLAVAAVLTLAGAWGLRSVRFDYNLLNLQAPGTESVEWERRILATAHRSGFVALSSASTLDELRRLDAAFAALPTVSAVDSAVRLFPEQQEEKRAVIAAFAPLVAPVRIAPPRPLDPPRLLAALDTLGRRIALGATEAPPGEVRQRLARLRDSIARLADALRRAPPAARDAALGHFQEELYRDFVQSLGRLQASLDPRPLGIADVPEELRRQFISDRGHFLMQIHPAVDIWDRAQASRFLADLRRVDPAVTGTAVIAHESLRLMERAWRQGALYALGLVAAISWLMLRRLRETVLAMLPLGLGMLWTVGALPWLGQSFSMANVFALPLLLGAAAEYGLNIVVRFQEGRAHGGPRFARSTIVAVLVNGLTTVAGFGSLMLADHRGIFGLGLLLTLGTALILVAALAVLPALLRVVPDARARRA